jgi:ABC-2 type transport system ATP-binding protein
MRTTVPAIECRHLSKAFGRQSVLESINLQVEPATLFALIGPMGAGKTTLLKILATLITPSEGTALINGVDVRKNPFEVRKMIGLITSEERSLYWRLTGRQNLRFFASLHGLKAKEMRERIEDLMREVGLSEKADTRVRMYSSGMRQALGIARGMLHDPPVLLVDEPTRSLSLDITRKVQELLLRRVRKEGKTVLMSSHNLTEIERLADRAAILNHGKIGPCGKPTDILSEAIKIFQTEPQDGI